METINNYCPRSGKPVQGDSLTAYKGYVVGFCNPGCRDDFAQNTDNRPNDTTEAGKGTGKITFVAKHFTLLSIKVVVDISSCFFSNFDFCIFQESIKKFWLVYLSHEVYLCEIIPHCKYTL